jgi:hypothetical protein
MKLKLTACKYKHCSLATIKCCRYEVDGCDIVWAVKDASMSSVFLDQGAAEFLLSQLNSTDDKAQLFDKRPKYRMDLG